MESRIGQGYDIHPLVAGRPLVLGGVEIPFDRGLLGHSDGDVLTHAVADALLGGAGLGDLGSHFPADDESLRGASSIGLLREVCALVAERGFCPVNIDSTVVAELPKLAPHIAAMRKTLGEAVGLPPEAVSVKAKRGEGLDAVGRVEAIVAQAVVLLAKRSGRPG